MGLNAAAAIIFAGVAVGHQGVPAGSAWRDAPLVRKAGRPRGFLLERGERRRVARQGRSSLLASKQAPALPTTQYVRKLTVANITRPTAMPPPPPTLDSWEDAQPLDTMLGNLVVNRFTDGPTVTPPPLQSAIALATSCPLLLTWPSNLDIDSPSTCQYVMEGNLSNAQGVGPAQASADQGSGQVLSWLKSCAPTEMRKSMSYVITYYMPGGDKFGSSFMMPTLTGNYLVLQDCQERLRYTVQEKVYISTSQTHPESCQKHRSCDGTVYLQYFIRDAGNVVVAQTPYLHIFQEEFVVSDPEGFEIATVKRLGGWQPDARDCSAYHENSPINKWQVRFAEKPPGLWATKTEQWPIAEMVTMISHQDLWRLPSGLLSPSGCEISRGLSFSFGLLCFFLCSGACTVCFRHVIADRLYLFFASLENFVCVRKHSKPNRFEKL